MNKCTRCGSFAINPNLHGRSGKDDGLCDVCFWRAKAEKLEREIATANQAHDTTRRLWQKDKEDLAAANKRINDLTTQRDRAMADYETEGMKAGRMADRIAELEADLVARDKRASDLNIGRTAQAELALQEFEKMRVRILELEADVARMGTTTATVEHYQAMVTELESKPK